MSLFLTNLVFRRNENSDYDDGKWDAHGDESGKVIVTYQPTSIKKEHSIGDAIDHAEQTLEVPLFPSTDGLKLLDITIHSSSTKAYDMGSKFNDWFSVRFGYEVILAYLGGNRRPVLGSLSPRAATNRRSQASSWLSAFTQNVPSCLTTTGDRPSLCAGDSIAFADVAPYLIASETSLQDVSSRVAANEPMEITKFLPNIIISGPATAFEEDFWTELRITTTAKPDQEDTVKFRLAANCGRCVSTNVDYATGKPDAGEPDSVLKKLMNDRRVDKGMKHGATFGRYGFLDRASNSGSGGHNADVWIRLGDRVEITKMNRAHATFGESLEEKASKILNPVVSKLNHL
jgi:uncharacterized protein YcbX